MEPNTIADDTQTSLNYLGQKSALFSLTLATSLLSIVTLGIYRFWQKTRIRKYIWSSIQLDGDSVEYTGTGLEKLLGFLVAIIFLAVYLGVLQMILFYFGLNMFVDPETNPELALGQMAAIYISLLAVLPFIYFAIYRGRRYRMARTRWRGIRFGMDKAAWGYAARACGFFILNIFTLGLLSPLAAYRLEKYMIERTHFGDNRFTLSGKWTEMYSAMKHYFIAIIPLAIGVVMLTKGIMENAGTQTPFASGENPAVLGTIITGGAFLLFGYIWMIIGSIYYQTRCFTYLTNHTTLADTVSFETSPRPWKIIGLVFLGFMIIGAILITILMITGYIARSISWSSDPSDIMPNEIGFGSVIFSVLLYLGTLAVINALIMILINQPILRHVVTETRVKNAQSLSSVHQRPYDKDTDAEGFADALDVGGAF